MNWALSASGNDAASKRATVHLSIGPMRPDEIGFVTNTWKESARRAPANRKLRSSDFYLQYNEDVARVLDANPIVLVARDEKRPGFAYGWACALPTPEVFALVYVYTKFDYRRFGIMKKLLGETLAYVPEDLPTAYCARSRFDRTFERYGMEPMELADVLEQVKGAA